MIIRSLLIGLASTGLLVALLVLSRILGAPAPQTIELVEIETVVLEEPPPPPNLSEPEDPEDPPPPPAPKIELPSEIDDLKAPKIALSLSRLDLKTPIEPFHTDTAPAQIPVIRQPKPTTQPTPQTSQPAPPEVVRPPIRKAYYAPSELDSLPTAIRTGQFRWPSRARGTRGSVRLEIEIDENGRVSVIRVLSTTDPALSLAATQVARGSRFTAPRKNGQKVKARFSKTYVLKKP